MILSNVGIWQCLSVCLWPLQNHGQQRFVFALHIRNRDNVSASGGFLYRNAFFAHFAQGHDLIARRMDDFERIAHAEFIFHVNGCPAIGVYAHDIADVLAGFRAGIAANVVLHLVRLVTLKETIGVAAIGQPFEFRV